MGSTGGLLFYSVTRQTVTSRLTDLTSSCSILYNSPEQQEGKKVHLGHLVVFHSQVCHGDVLQEICVV